MKLETLNPPVTNRYNIGMYHDGTTFRVVQWSAISPYRNFLLFNSSDTKMFTLSEIEGSGIRKALVAMVEIGQFHFVPTESGGVIMSGFLTRGNYDIDEDRWRREYGVEIGVEVNADYSVNWAEIRDNDAAMGGSGNCYSMGKGYNTVGNEHTIKTRPAPYSLTINKIQYHIMRSGVPFLRAGNTPVCLHFQVARPTTATKFTISNKNLFYFNTGTVYIYKIDDDLIDNETVSRVTKLTPKKIIVDVKPSPDGRVLMVVTKSQIFFYSTVNWTLIRILVVQKTKLPHGLEFGAWSQDGLTFAVMCRDFIQIWDNDN